MLKDPAHHHLDQVQAVIEGDGAAGAISASWKRSAIAFGVDPASQALPQILTAAELSGHQEKTQGIINAAREELDQLFRISRPAGYVVLMSDAHGVVVDHRLEEAPSRSAAWGNMAGGVWSEEAEGTNGTGTCLLERRPVTVHRSEHFRSQYIASSCSAAPIFGPGDELIGALDISSTDPALSENAHRLAGALVTESARSIEERYFRERFRRHWIIAIATPRTAGRTGLLAVDKDHRIAGIDHVARRAFAHAGPGTELWTLFERDERIFRAGNGDGDFAAHLTPTGGAEALPIVITPPEPSAAVWRSTQSAWFHSRPRKGLIFAALPPANARQSRGGLPPRVLRRAIDYIDAHLGERLELEQLALAAGVSLHHFARAFKASVGVPPYQFILQQRISRARHLLTSTDRPIADIAIAAGFSDQSHLTRHFRQALSVSPAAFRRSRR